MSRFLAPEVTVLKISQGDTITVKRRLNAGEQRAMFAQMATTAPDGTLRVNTLDLGLAQILGYLVDWSLTDDTGAVVGIRGEPPEVVRAALDALDPDSFREIREAIETHDAGVAAARAQEKKVPATASASSPISPSPVSTTGAMNGSVPLTQLSTTS